MKSRTIFIANSLDSISEGISIDAEFGDGRQSLSERDALPIPKVLRALLFEVCDPADCLVHKFP